MIVSKNTAYRRLFLSLTCLLIPLFVNRAYGAKDHSNLTCAITKGIYTSKADSALRVTFSKIKNHPGWVSNVALEVTSLKSDSHYWFLFDRGSSDLISVISTTNIMRPGWSPPSPDDGNRPLGSGFYYAFGTHLNYIYATPEAGSIAPHFIFIPALPGMLWNKASPRERIPQALFVLSRCK
jgi:hypothetical protein